MSSAVRLASCSNGSDGIADLDAVTAIGAADRPLLLLSDVGQLVRQQPPSLAGAGRIATGRDDDVGADGVRGRPDGPGGVVGRGPLVDPYAGEVRSEFGLHVGPGVRVERLTAARRHDARGGDRGAPEHGRHGLVPGRPLQGVDRTVARRAPRRRRLAQARGGDRAGGGRRTLPGIRPLPMAGFSGLPRRPVVSHAPRAAAGRPTTVSGSNRRIIAVERSDGRSTDAAERWAATAGRRSAATGTAAAVPSGLNVQAPARTGNSSSRRRTVEGAPFASKTGR